MTEPNRTAGAALSPASSHRLEFPSYDLLVDAIPDASLNATILRRDERPWRLAYWVTGSAILQSGMDGAPNTSEVCVAPDRTGVLLVGPGAPPKFIDGREVGADSLCLLRPGSLVDVATPSVSTWLAVTAPPGSVEREAALLEGAPATSALAPTVSFPSNPGDVAALRALLLDLTGALESAPRGLHPEAATNVDRTLLRCLARYSLEASPRRAGRRPLRVDRPSVFRSIFEFLRSLGSGPVYVEDLCLATGLPERTLRHVFLEQFGESPVRVLRARRLCLVYDALHTPGIGLKQIRRVAESYGFWHMGQFSADYRALLGERPSDTVRKARLSGARARAPRGGTVAALLPLPRAASR